MNNPNFKETNKTTIENIEWISDVLVYTLKNISNAFYLACIIDKKNIEIYKYTYETKAFKNIGKINIINYYYTSMKYFYNPLNKQEYFFIINENDEIEIYLIKSETNFELIQKLKFINKDDINENNNNDNILINIDEDDNDNNTDSIAGDTFTSFNYSDVLYDENDKNVYVIINYLIMQNAGGSMSSLDCYNSKSNNIYIFKDEKLNLIKTFKYDIDFNVNNITYIKNNLNKKYLIDAHNTNDLILIEIKPNYNNYEIENMFNDDNNKNILSNFIKSQCYYDSCIIYGRNNFDYLYVSEGNKLMIINLTQKNIDVIDFNQIYLRNIYNWDKNYLIFFQIGEIYIYDITKNKIITRNKKENCIGFRSYHFQNKNEALGIFKY